MKDDKPDIESLNIEKKLHTLIMDKAVCLYYTDIPYILQEIAEQSYFRYLNNLRKVVIKPEAYIIFGQARSITVIEKEIALTTANDLDYIPLLPLTPKIFNFFKNKSKHFWLDDFLDDDEKAIAKEHLENEDLIIDELCMFYEGAGNIIPDLLEFFSVKSTHRFFINNHHLDLFDIYLKQKISELSFNSINTIIKKIETYD